MNINGIILTPAQAYEIYQKVHFSILMDEAEHHLSFAVDELVQENILPKNYVISKTECENLAKDFLNHHNKTRSEKESWEYVIKQWKNQKRSKSS